MGLSGKIMRVSNVEWDSLRDGLFQTSQLFDVVFYGFDACSCVKQIFAGPCARFNAFFWMVCRRTLSLVVRHGYPGD